MARMRGDKPLRVLIGCCRAAVLPAILLMSLFRAPVEIGCIFGLATRRWPSQHPDQRPLQARTSGAFSFSCIVLQQEPVWLLIFPSFYRVFGWLR